MRRKMTKWLIGLGLFANLCSCVPDSVRDEIAVLKRKQEESRREIEGLKHEQQVLFSYVENESRAMWTQQLCKSGKIAEFISEVQAGLPGACTAGSLETALFFLNGLPEATASFRPGQNVSKLPLSREGQLKNLIDPHDVHPSTKLLVLVQPAQETEEAHAEALATGTKYIGIVRSMVPSETKLRLLGPHLLPCRLRGEVIKRFQGPMDKPVPGEPPERAPRIRVWAFRVDC